MATYIATYIVDNNEINISVDGTQLLSSFIGQKAYLYVTDTAGQHHVIDLSEYMLRQNNLVYTDSLTTISTSLTDLQIAGYGSNNIPFINPNTNGFPNRLNVYDPYITPGVYVSWTSINTPDVRDDIYQRDMLNDLVIYSNNNKDFSNCLVSVNGVFHKTYFFNNELYVEGGFSNIKNCKQNKIAIYDTSSLGGHSIIPITISNVDNSNTAPFSGITLTFPNTDFTGMTILLVFNGYLYALDDKYRLINTNRMMIDIAKIDLLDQFLHDPNTSYVLNNPQIVANDTTGNTVPTVENEITYYLQAIYPNAIANVTSAVNFTAFNLYSESSSGAITPADMINDFLASWPYSVPNGASVLLADYQKYVAPNTIVTSLPMTDFTNPEWIYALLTQSNTFLIAIKNPLIYKRTYTLYRSQIPSQYVEYSPDTPRGILQYNYSKSFPYLMYSESNHLNHNFSIDYSKKPKDVYKTAINQIAVPSPRLDVKGDINYPVRLLELYSPIS